MLASAVAVDLESSEAFAFLDFFDLGADFFSAGDFFAGFFAEALAGLLAFFGVIVIGD